MKKKTGELIMSCLFVALGIAAIAVIHGQSSTAISNTGATTFKTFPTLYGIMIIVLAGMNAVKLIVAYKHEKKIAAKESLTGEKPNDDEEAQKLNRTIAIRVAGMFFLSLAFAVLLKKVHFALLCFVFLFASFTLLGRKKVWLNTIVSAVGSGAVYLIFVILLKLPL